MASNEIGKELRLTVILESEENPLINRRDTGSEQKNVGLTVKLEMRNWGWIKFGTEWRKCGKAITSADQDGQLCHCEITLSPLWS